VIINWYGGGCYKIQASGADIVVDPSTSPAGGRLKGDLIIKTKTELPLDINGLSDTEISVPGEYETSGVKIKGVAIPTEDSRENVLKTAYRIEADGLSIALLGDVSEELSEDALDDLGDIDILFVPGKPISGKLIKSIDPAVAIPGWGDPKVVMNETGQKPESTEKLTIKKKDLEAEEGFRLVVLKS